MSSLMVMRNLSKENFQKVVPNLNTLLYNTNMINNLYYNNKDLFNTAKE